MTTQLASAKPNHNISISSFILSLLNFDDGYPFSHSLVAELLICCLQIAKFWIRLITFATKQLAKMKSLNELRLRKEFSEARCRPATGIQYTKQFHIRHTHNQYWDELNHVTQCIQTDSVLCKR